MSKTQAKAKPIHRKEHFNQAVGNPEQPWGKRLTDATIPAPPTLKQQIQDYVRTAVSAQAAEDGFETFSEADDFEDEEPEPPWVSEYEMSEEQEASNFASDDASSIKEEGESQIIEKALEDAPQNEGEQDNDSD